MPQLQNMVGNNKEDKPSQEQQQQFELFIAGGGRIIQSPEFQQNFLQQTTAQDPIDAIASSTVTIINRLEEVAQENGERLDPDVELQAANVLMGQIITVYEQNGGQKLSDEQKYQAFSLAISAYLDDAVKTGKISEQELQQLAEMMQQNPEGQKIAQQIQSGEMPQRKQQPTGLLGG